MYRILRYIWGGDGSKGGGGSESEAGSAKIGEDTNENPAQDVSRILRPTVPAPSKPLSATFTVGDVRYIASGFPKACALQHPTSPSLATVIKLDGTQQISAQLLSTLIPNLDLEDDVFKPDFLHYTIFVADSPAGGEDLIGPDAIAFLKKLGNQWMQVIHISDKVTDPPTAGVYIASQGSLFEVFRVYNDDQCTFMTTTVRAPDGSHIPLTTAAEQPGVGQVAVCSRLSKLLNKPSHLQGLRIAIKDNFHLRGIKTSLCNRAYYDLYPAQTQTAVCISQLEAAGSCIVGTTKLAAFAATEEPIECVDYQAPWNPRGDGYQSPAGSSSGSGAAASSYDWLDVAIGSDTSGSGRRPAHWNGCFGMRPTHGAIDTQGFVHSFRQFDVPTIFTRDIYACRQFAGAWYGEKLVAPPTQLPVQLIVPEDYLPFIRNEDQRVLIDHFVSDLETTLNVKRQSLSLEKAWDAAPPGQANGQTFSVYMNKVARNSFFYDDYHGLKDFRKDYVDKYHKAPYISPPVRWQWDLAATISPEQRDEAIQRLAVYRKWFSDTIMEVNSKRTIMVIPIENVSARYRDEATTAFDPIGVPMLFLSPILGGPECTLPIGHVPYQSKISGHEEQLPVGISLLSAPGSDLELLDLAAECLQQSRRPTQVKTGKVMF